jgi:glycosyltransferase involved in cell wall biosynthesis
MGGMPWGGSEVLWNATALHALEQGDQVFVSVYKWKNLHQKIKLLIEKGAEVHFRRSLHEKVGRIEKLIRFVTNRRDFLKKDYQTIVDFKPDVVFISLGEIFEFAFEHKRLYNLLIEHNIPYSFVCHSNVQQYSYIPPKEIYPGAVDIFKNAKNVYFVSKRQWKLTERRLACKLQNAQLTWNPLNLIAPTRPLSWSDDSVIHMALVGAFVGYKGHDTAMEVLSATQWKERKWKLNLYGSGSGEKYLKDLAGFFDIQDRIEFHGHVIDVTGIWKQNHILLIPSAGEGLPISLVEAMACGRPSVVTDVGGNTELIVENETGFVSAAPTTESFSEAMERAWLSQTKWLQMGLKSFEVINKKLDKKPERSLYQKLKSSCSPT